MEQDWMGRYRPLMEELTRHTNIVIKGSTIKHEIGGTYLIPQEWQVLEYLNVHRDSCDHMIMIADQLQIPQSSFSKYVKHLCATGLVDKYQMKGNKKNIILKPSEKGIEAYKKNCEAISEGNFHNFFNALSSLSDKDLNTVIDAFKIHNTDLSIYDEKEEQLELMRK